MRILVRLIVSTIAVLVTDLLLRGVHAGDFLTGLLVAVTLGLLNTFLRPLLILFTLPVTLLTLGLFLLVINAGMVMLAARLVPGFTIDAPVFWWALLFSIILSIVTGLLQSLDRPRNRPPQTW